MRPLGTVSDVDLARDAMRRALAGDFAGAWDVVASAGPRPTSARILLEAMAWTAAPEEELPASPAQIRSSAGPEPGDRAILSLVCVEGQRRALLGFDWQG